MFGGRKAKRKNLIVAAHGQSPPDGPLQNIGAVER